MISVRQRFSFPELPDAVPSRGSKLTRFLGRVFLGLIGWRITGEIPALPKMVLIVVPHTSNVDFFVGAGALFALGLQVSFLAKHSLFWEPFGTYLRWVGGVPIDRRAAQGAVGEAVHQFQEREQFVLAITPEGTRKEVRRWKTGFYHIAVEAGVPIVPLAFDYDHKEIRFGPPFMPSGADMDAEIKSIAAYFSGVKGRNRRVT